MEARRKAVVKMERAASSLSRGIRQLISISRYMFIAGAGTSPCIFMKTGFAA
jgi:hypothetical protein